MKRFAKTSLLTLSICLSACGLSAPAMAAGYQVQDQDTFWILSQRYGLPLQSILQANPGVDPLNLQTGQTIELPVALYTVQNGETFWTIANKLGISLASLTAANPGIDPYNLYAGLKLRLPAGQASGAVSVKSASYSAANTVKTASGQILPYRKTFNAVATAYSAAPEENGKWGAVDYLGNPLRLGTIAVDPSVIPMGSRVYITGYQDPSLPPGGMIAYANDQGGAIKGNRIDIFIPGSAEKAGNFGIQNVKIYILD